MNRELQIFDIAWDRLIRSMAEYDMIIFENSNE